MENSAQAIEKEGVAIFYCGERVRKRLKIQGLEVFDEKRLGGEAWRLDYKMMPNEVTLLVA